MRRRSGRPIDGIVLLDKPTGMSSNAALQKVRRLFNARKAGHTGSLDPLATGMLPICFGEATKLCGLLLDSDKRYLVELALGSQTDTADADGQVVKQAPWQQVTAEQINAVLPQFIGEQTQVPPMYSALKHEGERLYDLARRGIEVERKARSIVIHALQYVALDGNLLKLEVSCSKGTYVRTLGEDIAQALGTLAHVHSLRRLQVGPFFSAMHRLADLHDMEEAGDRQALNQCLLPIKVALTGWPAVQLNAQDSHRLLRGQSLQLLDAPRSECIALLDEQEQFLGIGRYTADGQVAPRRLVATG